MGYKVYGEEETKGPRWKEALKWLVILALWFPSTIGGWLLFCGLPAIWIIALTALIALVGAWYFSK